MKDVLVLQPRKPEKSKIVVVDLIWNGSPRGIMTLDEQDWEKLIPIFKHGNGWYLRDEVTLSIKDVVSIVREKESDVTEKIS